MMMASRHHHTVPRDSTSLDAIGVERSVVRNATNNIKKAAMNAQGTTTSYKLLPQAFRPSRVCCTGRVSRGYTMAFWSLLWHSKLQSHRRGIRDSLPKEEVGRGAHSTEMEASPSSVLARRTVCPHTLARQPRASLQGASGLSTRAASRARLKARLRSHDLLRECYCRPTAAVSTSRSVRGSSFNPEKRSSSSLRQEGLLPSNTGTAWTLEQASAHVSDGAAPETRSEVALSSPGSFRRDASSGSEEHSSHFSDLEIASRSEQEEEQGREKGEAEGAVDLFGDTTTEAVGVLLAELPGQGLLPDEDSLTRNEATSLHSHDGNSAPVTAASEVAARQVALPSDDAAPVSSNQGQGRPVSLQAKAFGSGLLRSPTTGGVQSATSAHGLPDPAVAVRNLVAQSRQGHLCTVMSRMAGRRRGYPFGAMVAFATDVNGLPIFSLSPLEIHARNLLADPRCTLVVQIPGWSGLADARVTLFGDVYPLAPEHQEWANRIFRARHHQKTSEKWGNSLYFRMERVCDLYFVGGFGTVAWVPVEDYISVQPDKIASEGSEETLEVLNSRVADRVRDSLSSLVKEGAPLVDSVTFIAVDGKGVDIRIHQGGSSNVRRLSFDCASAVETVDEAQAALEDVLQREALPASLVD